MQNKLEALKQDAHWFVEMAFISINRKNEMRANQFLDAASTLNPGYILIDIARASIHMHKMELKEAETLLKKVLEKDPKQTLAMTFLAICHTLLGNTEGGKKIFEEMKKGEDPDAKKIASESEKFIKENTKKESKKDDRPT